MMRRVVVLAGIGAVLAGGSIAARRSRPATPATPVAVLGAGAARGTESPAAPALIAAPAAVAGGDPTPFDGLDLTRMREREGAWFAPSHAAPVRLTLDPDLQRSASAILASRHLPEAAVVVMEIATGRLLAYASHVERGAQRDLCVEATAPSASVFKIVTAAALVEDAHLGPDTSQCYRGGEQRIVPSDLLDDPRRDAWCSTLAGAMGRSLNAVFARLADKHLTATELEAMARRFGYGEPLPFDVPVQPGTVHVPPGQLELARTAAGFWNTTLSPLQAAEMSAIVARGGEGVQPSIVETTSGHPGAGAAPGARPLARSIERETAEKLAAMLAHTVRDGTSFRSFHDGRGVSFLPGVGVAAKTGTLTDHEAQRYYTWFTGYAPSEPLPGLPQVAVGVLVVNGPTWQVKANVVARDVLRAYFAGHGAKGISRPSIGSVARHPRHRAAGDGSADVRDVAQ